MIARRGVAVLEKSDNRWRRENSFAAMLELLSDRAVQTIVIKQGLMRDGL
jgi:hypothetical protein